MAKEMVADPPKNQLSLVVVAQNIASGLAAFESRKADLITLKEEVEGLKIESLEDKAGIKQVTEARKKLKAARVEIEKEGKSMRDPLTAVSKHVSAKEKELVDIIEPTEKALKTQEDWVKAEEKRIEEEEQRQAEARIQSRIDRLREYGYEIDLTFIKAVSDDDFEKLVAHAKVEHEKEQAAIIERQRAEQARREQDERDRAELKILREKQEAADKILREREEEIVRKEKEIKEAEEARIRQEAHRLKSEREAEIKRRNDTLYGFGLKFDYKDEHYKGYGCFVSFIDIQVQSADEWAKLIEEITPVIERGKKKEESERLENEERIRKESAEKALTDQKEREAETKRQEEERLAQASDKDKFSMIVSYLEDTPYPEMRSAKHRKLLAEVKDLNAKVVAHIKAKA